jgi:magnesium transporter
MTGPARDLQEDPIPKETGQPEGLYGLTSQLVHAVGDALDEGDDARVRELIAPLHEADVADLIERFPAVERSELIKAAGEHFTGDVLANIEEDVRDDIVADLDTSELVEALTDLDTDDAVSVLEDMEPPQQREVLDGIPEDDRAAVEESLTFPENSAGRLMQRNVVALPAYWTIGQTIDYMREVTDLPEDFYEVIVIDPRHKPIGTVRLNRLLRTRRPVLLRDMMHTDIKTIPVTTDQEEVGYVFEQYDLVSAPVVSESGRLLGVVMVDDVVDVIQEEAEEDIMRLSGVAETDIYRAALETMWGRFTWLLVNLGTAILASIVIYQFDGSIDQMVALAVLMPIVASMGGNAGTQTMTVAVRAIATRDLTMGNAGRVLRKELLVAFANGCTFALLAGGAAAAWYQDIGLGLVIGGAMVINMVTAGLFGLTIPVALWRLRIDPATAAGVLLTTVTDVVGFLAFLGLGAAFLL